MMTTLHKDECGKGPKKTFAPPAQKLHSLMPYSLNSPKEETLGISSRETEARPNLLKARLEKKEKKATTEDGASSGQGKKVKAQDNKQAEKKEKEIWNRVCRVLMCDHCFHALSLVNLLPHVKESFLTGQRGELGKKQFSFHTPSLQEKSSLTNEEFEEIVQIVLQKSLQQCLETSSVQSIRCTQLDKEPGNALSTTDNDNADGERVMVPHILEISASQEDGIIPEIKTSKPGQPDPASSEKKFSKLSLSKRNKKARQCLVWVQCSSPNCEKWRQLRGNMDPSVLPDTWSCDQNTDLEYNRCDIPEETWTGCESEVAYASYIPGSIIWAKQYGYPWWPGMVECDPDLGEYFLFASHLDSLPSKYHVTFFGEIVSRAWIPVNMLKNFQELSLELAGVKKCRNKDCSQKLRAAMLMAQEAEQISIQERVKLFGFWSRYSGSTKDTMDHTGEGKDLMLSGAKGPVSSLEKEEESDLEKKKEGKKDPTLPSPKPTKIQTKKPKARRVADRRDGAQQRKSMNGSLGDEPAASPVPIKGRKEVHRNSDPDQPGPKKKFKAPQSKVSATGLSEEKEVRMVPEGLILPTHHRACPAMGKEGPGPQELQEAGSFPADDETSSDLDLEQLMEDVGKKPEPRVELRHRADTDEFTFFEE